MSVRRLSEHQVDEGDDPLSMFDADAEESSAVVGASSAQGKTSGDNTEEPMEPENKHLLSAIKLTASDNSNSHSPLSGPVSAGSTTFSPSDGLRVGQIATTPPRARLPMAFSFGLASAITKTLLPFLGDVAAIALRYISSALLLLPRNPTLGWLLLHSEPPPECTHVHAGSRPLVLKAEHSRTILSSTLDGTNNFFG